MTRIRAAHVRGLLRRRGFRRLYATRLTGQFGDGVFQASLAGAVLFSPERQAHPRDIALGFTVLLLPYSLIGPFAGVAIDRWWRQRVLVLANLVRALAVFGVVAVIAAGADDELLYLAALAVLSVNRFVLSSLSASLTHVLGTRNEANRELITANAFSTTCGGLATAAGGAAAIALRAALGSRDADYAVIAAAAFLPYLIASVCAARFGKQELGPDELDRARRESARDVVHGLLGGLAHIGALPAVRRSLAMIAAQRLGYGITLVSTVLLYRNFFHDDGVLRAGLSGLGQIAVAVAAGAGIAALVTPGVTRRVGPAVFCAALLAVGAVAQLVLGLQFALAPFLGLAFLLALISQAVKICVDTIVQTTVEDEFRGRVFSLYDTLVNITMVCAAVAAALSLPESGHSPAAVVVISVGYLALSVGYARSHVVLAPPDLMAAPAVVTGSAPPTAAARRRPRRAPSDRGPSAAPAGACRPGPPVAPAGSAGSP